MVPSAGEVAELTAPVGGGPEAVRADRGGAGSLARGPRSTRGRWPWATPPQAERLKMPGRPHSVVPPAGEGAEPAASGGRPSEPVRADCQRVGPLPTACRSRREGWPWASG